MSRYINLGSVAGAAQSATFLWEGGLSTVLYTASSGSGVTTLDYLSPVTGVWVPVSAGKNFIQSENLYLPPGSYRSNIPASTTCRVTICRIPT